MTLQLYTPASDLVMLSKYCIFELNDGIMLPFFNHWTTVTDFASCMHSNVTFIPSYTVEFGVTITRTFGMSVKTRHLLMNIKAVFNYLRAEVNSWKATLSIVFIGHIINFLITLKHNLI